jgi:thiamine transporter
MVLDSTISLKKIDWQLVLVLTLVLVGIAAILLGFYFVKKALEKNGKLENNKFFKYLKDNSNDLVSLIAFVVAFCTFMGGTVCIYFYADPDISNFVHFSTLAFGGKEKLIDTIYTFESSPLLIFSFVSLILTGVLTVLGMIKAIKESRVNKLIQGASILTSLLPLLLIAIYFTNFFKINDLSTVTLHEEWPSLDYCTYSSFFFYLSLLLIAVCKPVKVFSHIRYTTRDICEEGILIALAVVLDNFVKIKVQSGGGSVGFAAIPLFIIAIRHGPYKGFVASAVLFGIITCMLDGYGFQTYPFDYFIGFGGYCLVGLFFNLFKNFYKNKKENYEVSEFTFSVIGVTIGCLLAMVVRYIGSCASSMILYEYTLVDALIYNSTYIPMTMLLNWIAVIILLKPILLINKKFN